MPTTMETVAFGGWEHCVKLSNGEIELTLTTDIGPRVIALNTPGGPNHMAVFEETKGMSGGGEWRSYGGHRLWHSPEKMPRTYAPDNAPVKLEPIDGGAHLIQDVEPLTMLRKEMEIVLYPGKASARILHRITNCGQFPVQLAAWPITVMATGGREVVPQTRRDTGLIHNRTLSLWPYSRMQDPRVHWGDPYIVLDQDPSTAHPFKLGLSNEEGWGAYFNHGQMFVKHFAHRTCAEYPDGGCSYETYVCGSFIEIETVSPLHTLEPGAHIDHLERWDLYDGVQRPGLDEASISAALKGRVMR